MDRGAWQATVQGVVQSRIQLSNSLNTLTNMYHQPCYADEEIQTAPGWYNPGLFLATVLDLGSANTTETPSPACPPVGSGPEPRLKITEPQEPSLEDQPQIKSGLSFFPFRKEK